MRTAAMAVIGFLLAVLVAGCGSHSAPALSDRQLAKLVLQPSDIPGLERFANAREVSSEQSSVLEGDPGRFGRQRGWVARYRSAHGAKGLLLVASTVETFAMPGGAAKYFDGVRQRDEVVEGETGLASIEVSRVGDASYVYATPNAQRGTVRAVSVTWRDGRFVASTFANGFAEQMSVSDVLALAQRHERRLAAAG